MSDEQRLLATLDALVSADVNTASAQAQSASSSVQGDGW